MPNFSIYAPTPFATNDNRPTALVDAREPKNITRAHIPYTENTFADALRKGKNIGGRSMSPLMPHYELSTAEIKAVMAYLRQLSAELPPGVSKDSLHFATIVTSDVDAKQKAAMLAMMNTAFKQRNASQEEYSGRMRMPIDLLPRTLRKWQLSVWELKGPPETWGKQLTDYYQREPVFALVSGLSNSTWAPVHAFCKQKKVPCLLPSVALAPADTDFYSLYYSRGIALEANVLSKYLRELGKKIPHRLIQIYRDDEVGRSAAQILADALHGSDVQIENRVLSGQGAASIDNALKDIASTDAVMLWLRPSDLSAVNKATPTSLPAVAYVSGFLADDHNSFDSKAWTPIVREIYPYDLGDKRKKNAVTLKAWLKTWNLPLVNETFQSEVFFNLLFLTDLASQMLDNLYQDYMLERAEDMLSLGSNVSAYPHLSLAREQRFASKGAYIAHYGNNGNRVADTDWIVP